MFQALFNSLSGLFSFSRSLDTVSNNVSNMNTPGFRGATNFFQNIGGGNGTAIAGEGLRTSQGEFRPSDSETAVAVDGRGFFVLCSEEGDLYYSRAGEFEWNHDGYLVDSVNKFRVMFLDADGNLVPVNKNDHATIAPDPTETIDINGQIKGGTASFTMDNLNVFDTNGAVHKFSITLAAEINPTTNAATGNYKVTVKDGDTVLASNVIIQYDPQNFSAKAPFDHVDVTLNVGGEDQVIKIDFAGTASVTNILNTTMSAATPDGHGELGLFGTSFDSNGVLKFIYTQSETRTGPTLALATFPTESQLEMIGGRLVDGRTVGDRTIGRPGETGVGTIKTFNLENANVDLTNEFADMIIIQRGYQASSRVMTVSNEMIEQLYNSTRGG